MSTSPEKKLPSVSSSLHLASICKRWECLNTLSLQDDALEVLPPASSVPIFPHTVILCFNQKLGHKLLCWKAFTAVWTGVFCSRGYNNKGSLQAAFFQTLGMSLPV